MKKFGFSTALLTAVLFISLVMYPKLFQSNSFDQ